jgi:4-amino-4-deoxy-L-arabinose transferase-like glycosyltransferase
VGTFLTIDEVKWAEGSAQFLLALQSGDLAQTYWHFFPGITIAWGGALTLWVMCLPTPDLALCAQTRVEILPVTIGWLRLTPVLLTSLGITGVYLLGRKLLDEKVALLAALLLAFDPFFIAHSRILNGDAVAAIFMFLSLLAFLIYWLNESANQRMANANLIHCSSFATFALRVHHSLILSGAMAGLALLTKLPAPLIGLFIGGIGLGVMVLAWPKEGWLAVRRWLGALALWGGIALIVFVLLWPALWVAPVETLRRMYFDTFQVGGAGEGHDAFFLGQTLDDPGPWFYPYAIAFRLTPVVIVGLLITLGWLISRPRVQPPLALGAPFRGVGTPPASRVNIPNTELITTWVILAFIIFLIVFSSASPKKLDRYIMAVIPALIFLSAIGLAKIEQASRGKMSPPLSRFRAPLPLFPPALSLFLLAGLVALHLVFAILAAPYYLTYYNPLLGGPQRAASQVPVGWGEGLEQAAHYLNSLPNAESLAVSSWYSDIFDPYFTGQRASFADDGRAQLAADYVVFYVNQIQRQKPYLGLINYFRANKPVFVVKVGQMGQVSNGEGAPWVEVYQAPAAQSASGAPKIEGVAQLLAYKVAGNRVTGSKVTDDASNLLADNEVQVALFLRVLGPLPKETTFNVALAPISTPVRRAVQYPKGTMSPISVWHPTQMKGEWLEGAVIEWPDTLILPADMPAGDYRLSVLLQTLDGSTLAEFAISEKDPALVVK